jgi:ClpP class serine protease
LPRPPRTFRLTPELVAAHAGGKVVCLAAGAEGQNFRLHASRPDTYERVRADVIGWDGVAVVDASAVVPTVARVDVRGPIEQRAGYHDICGGWSDGNDAITERLCAALNDPECGAVLLCMDSPGGSPVGLAEGVRRVVEAKVATGKKIVGWVDDGGCYSAMYWWASGVCDVIYMPRDAGIGSVGARAAHGDISQALANEGVVVTHFCWPSKGKIAFTPDQPLSDLAIERGERDINLIGETFGAAVAVTRGLSIEAIRALEADCLTGPAGVAAGLADGIATYEETMTYALALAGGGDITMPEEEKDPEARAEGDEPEPGAEDEVPAKAKCGQCKAENDEDAAYCKACGLSMGGKPAAEPADEEEEAPPSSKPEPAKDARRSAAAPRAQSYASLAGLAPTASQPAILTALSGRVGVFMHAASLTGAKSPGEIKGGLDALAKDAAASGEMRTKLTAAQSKANASERMDILKSLSDANVHAPGELFEHTTTNGKITGRKPAKLWGPGPEGRTLANLRGYAKAKLENAGPVVKRDPFQPSEDAAKKAVTTAGVKQAESAPAVQRAVKNGIPLEDAAAIHAREFGGAK